MNSSMNCDICGKIMTVVPKMMGVYTVHKCITGYDILHMYNTHGILYYRGLPDELDDPDLQYFLQLFLIKSKQSYLIKALRNSTINRLIE